MVEEQGGGVCGEQGRGRWWGNREGEVVWEQGGGGGVGKRGGEVVGEHGGEDKCTKAAIL